MADKQSFDLAALESALTELGRRAHAADRTIEIAVYGGSALLLTLNRKSTRATSMPSSKRIRHS
jgi:hypothetical protein